MRRIRRKSGSSVIGAPEESVTVDIAALGAAGDGIAAWAEKPLYIPFTLPGERVRARIQGRRGDGWAGMAESWIVHAPGRATPACVHFGLCGGCALQHVPPAAYQDWKQTLVLNALRQHGVVPPGTHRFATVAPASRRRATFSAHRQADGGVALGFHRSQSHKVIDITMCAVLDPVLLALVVALRGWLSGAMAKNEKLDITATLSETGIDLVFIAPRRGAWADTARIAALAGQQSLARVTWIGPQASPETLFQAVVPQVRFGGVAVDLSPGAFLQPTRAGEAVLRDWVLEAAGSAKNVADLFAGCGTFTFPLARTAKVLAVENNAAAVAALVRAANHAGLSGRVIAQTRNLDHAPLMPQELKRYDAVVFDPPRAGAAAQAHLFAQSGLRRIVAVSCNPASFARDARTLVDGGFVLESLAILDQFLWSTHVELVALFRR